MRVALRKHISTSRPREGGDPYAVSARSSSAVNASGNNGRQGLWVPAFAGTTLSVLAAITSKIISTKMSEP
jgi:hypothetical protein